MKRLLHPVFGALFLFACQSAATDNCVAMIACDNALAAEASTYTSRYPQGLDDPQYGDGGDCYRGDRAACDQDCASALPGLRNAVQQYVDNGEIDTFLPECEE